MSDLAIRAVALSGELEIGRRDEIRRALQIPDGSSAVLLDLSDITYADSTALAELLRFRAEAEAAQVAVAMLVSRENSQFRRLLAYAGLGDAFEIFGDRGSALTYLGERSA